MPVCLSLCVCVCVSIGNVRNCIVPRVAVRRTVARASTRAVCLAAVCLLCVCVFVYHVVHVAALVTVALLVSAVAPVPQSCPLIWCSDTVQLVSDVPCPALPHVIPCPALLVLCTFDKLSRDGNCR